MKKTFKVFAVLLGVVVIYGVLVIALSELGGDVAWSGDGDETDDKTEEPVIPESEISWDNEE